MIYDLNTIIREKIEHNAGKINFADFMQLALYHPEFGYYCRPEFRLGRAGDFTTAPETSPLFGECLANFAMQFFSENECQTILELGAGSGRLAYDLLNRLKNLDIQANYYIYEISPSLRQQQQALLSEYPVVWLDHLPIDFEGLIIANEVLDALPVNLIQIEGGVTKEKYVRLNGSNFDWTLVETQPIAFDVHDGYQTETHPHTAEFMKNLSSCLRKGIILLLDYGYGESEYYHPQRSRGTLTCFHQHQKHDNPLIHVGNQDITAHVNFSLVAETSVQNECDILGFTTQSAFLLECGLIELALQRSHQLSSRAEFELNQSIKKLTMPTEMGEVIKAMAIGKSINIKPKGFHTLDRRRDL